MDTEIDALLARLREIETELEQKLAEQRDNLEYRLEKRRVIFNAGVAAQHRRLKTSLIRFIHQSPWLALVTAPVVYSLVVPIALLDALVWVYQRICFFVWNIPRVRRSDYVALDRHNLAYLNGVQKLNCVYCGYANGVIAYTREVASRSEQFWCPIKHALRVREPHRRYRNFLEFGDAEGFRDRLAALQAEVRQIKPRR
ncbi:MAG: hypothetical protein O3B08_01655 [Proteobacteria bacterium]|nr:hypothetical protein [Pseudomonadota bacterium]